MIVKGQKRKFPPENVEVSDRSSPTWESQRQFVFSVSLSKYQRNQELPEPSLLRSVLIANTLQMISQEACRAPSVDREVSPSSSSVLPSKERESILSEVPAARHHSAVAVTNSCPVVSSNYLSDCVTSRFAASCHLNTSNVPLPVADEDEDWGLLSIDPDFSLSAAISSILTALDSAIDGSPQAVPRTPLQSLENLPRSPEGSVAWAKQGVRGCESSWEQHEECRVRESSMEVMRSSYLSDLTVEDLFQDIDTSLLERDNGGTWECIRGSRGGSPVEDCSGTCRLSLPLPPSHDEGWLLAREQDFFKQMRSCQVR